MKRKIAAVTLVVLLCACIGLMVGCTDSTSDEEEPVPQTEAASSADTIDGEKLEDPSDYIGEVTYASTSYLAMNLYSTENNDPVEDYSQLDISTLVALDEIEYVILDETAIFYTVEDKTLNEAAFESIAEGSYVAVTETADGSQTIFIYSSATADSDNDTEETEGAAAEVSSDDFVSDVYLALVEGQSEDGNWLLTPYVLADETSEYTITDYAAVEWEHYTATEQIIDYTFEDLTQFHIADSGVLSDATSDTIAVGDLLVIYSDESDTTHIVIYQSDNQDTE